MHQPRHPHCFRVTFSRWRRRNTVTYQSQLNPISKKEWWFIHQNSASQWLLFSNFYWSSVLHQLYHKGLSENRLAINPMDLWSFSPLKWSFGDIAHFQTHFSPCSLILSPISGWILAHLSCHQASLHFPAKRWNSISPTPPYRAWVKGIDLLGSEESSNVSYPPSKVWGAT